MRPRKRFGQHFLEPAWVSKVVEAIQPAPGDRFLEIGPGTGALTAPLAARVAALVAVEVDRDLAASLERRALPGVTVLAADVIDIDLAALIARDLGATPARPIRVAGNLPYYISTPILLRLLEVAAATAAVRDAMLMLQKEVAERLLARPGSRDYGVLTLTTALGADVEALLELPPGAFRPPPRVQSTLVRLAFRPPPPDVRHPDLVVAIVRAMFTQRRKMLANALKPFAEARGRLVADVLARASVDPRCRPETLDLADVARLADAFAS